MTLVRWSPLNDMSLLHRQMNRLFSNSFQGWPDQSEASTNWVPSTDIHETETELVLTADLPGIDPKNIDLRVENNVLTMRGERKMENSTDSENYHRVERTYGSFVRSFTLATTVDADKIRADYKDGVLTIHLPKAEQAKPKRIQIEIAA